MEQNNEIRVTIPEGYEIDTEHSTFECIKFKKKHKINTWKDIKRIEGCFINNYSEIRKLELPINKDCFDRNVFISERYAKSALALAQISQLMPYYGGEITDEEWEKDNYKYAIEVSNGKIYESWCKTKHLIAFHTKGQLQKFLSFPENVQLVKDFYMIS